MKVLMKGVTPDGVHIQIEDWSESYNCHNYGDLIAAYPKIRGISARAEYQVESNGTAQRIFRRLEKGEAKLTDFDFRVMQNCMRVSIREALREGEEKWKSRS